MEDFLPFLTDNLYIKSNRVKSIKVFWKFLDNPSFSNEVFAFRFDFSSDGYPKLSLAFDRNGNIGEQTEYDLNGKKIKKIINYNNSATRQRPVIVTTIYNYNNGLLFEEEDITEDSSYGVYSKKISHRRIYIYDEKSRLIEKKMLNLYTESVDVDKYEYVNSNLMKELDIMSDGRLNMIIFHKFDNQGRIIEKRAVKSEEDYYDPNFKYQYYRHCYEYNIMGLLQEKLSFDKENKLKSNMKYFYDSKNILLRTEEYENGKLTTKWRFEFSF